MRHLFDLRKCCASCWISELLRQLRTSEVLRHRKTSELLRQLEDLRGVAPERRSQKRCATLADLRAVAPQSGISDLLRHNGESQRCCATLADLRTVAPLSNSLRRHCSRNTWFANQPQFNGHLAFTAPQNCFSRPEKNNLTDDWRNRGLLDANPTARFEMFAPSPQSSVGPRTPALWKSPETAWLAPARSATPLEDGSLRACRLLETCREKKQRGNPAQLSHAQHKRKIRAKPKILSPPSRTKVLSSSPKAKNPFAHDQIPWSFRLRTKSKRSFRRRAK